MEPGVRALQGLRNLFAYYDLYERHAVVGRLLHEFLAGGVRGSRVLDVGGRAGLLGQYVPFRVTSINSDGSGDLIGGGAALPFPDGAFAAVVSIDTVEHIPREQRLPFLRECMRVAQRCVVVAAPYGSKGHRDEERRLDQLYRSVYGRSHLYLGEHVEHGLPGPEEIEGWVRDLDVTGSRTVYTGDYVWQSRTFERTVLERREERPSRLRNLGHRVLSWAVLHPVKTQDRPYPTANRFYLLLEKRR